MMGLGPNFINSFLMFRTPKHSKVLFLVVVIVSVIATAKWLPPNVPEHIVTPNKG